MQAITVLPVRGLPEVASGDDLGVLVAAAADLRDGDVVVVSQKVVSKAEGAVVARDPGADPADARRRLAREQAARTVCDDPVALVVATRHGFVCANAGVDGSNVPGDGFTVLPDDPDASAERLRDHLATDPGVDVAVIVADTFGRPWRQGQTDVAIGAAGIEVLRDERGGRDRHGRPLEVTLVAVADEVAAAADLVRRKGDGVPVVIVRGLAGVPATSAEAGARPLVRDPESDLFLHGRGWLAQALATRADPPPDRPGAPTAAEWRCVRAAVGGRAPLTVEQAEVVVRPHGMDTAALVACGEAAAIARAVLLDFGYRVPVRIALDAPVAGAGG